jgi:hypothetical protein
VRQTVWGGTFGFESYKISQDGGFKSNRRLNLRLSLRIAKAVACKQALPAEGLHHSNTLRCNDTGNKTNNIRGMEDRKAKEEDFRKGKLKSSKNYVLVIFLPTAENRQKVPSIRKIGQKIELLSGQNLLNDIC